MTLYETFRKHDEASRYHAARAVQCLQSGRHFQASIAMGCAAEERHLAFETHDTWIIVGEALREYTEAVLVARKAAA